MLPEIPNFINTANFPFLNWEFINKLALQSMENKADWNLYSDMFYCGANQDWTLQRTKLSGQRVEPDAYSTGTPSQRPLIMILS